jgi:uncharacterized phosphosugar-binding protein
MIQTYFSEIQRILDEILKTQKPVMEKTAEILADAIADRRNIFVFGCSHAGILAQEMFYRTGGLAVINPILPPGLTLEVRPVTMTTDMERLEGYGKTILKSSGIKEGDVLIIHSVSGRNAVPVEMAIEARKTGVTVVALTNVKYSKSVTSRHSSGKRLFEVCDYLLDNCGSIGDTVCKIEGFDQKVAASSTVSGAAILNAILAETVDRVVKKGLVPPVFISANMEGGDEYNARILKEYKDNIKYMD